LKISFKLKVKDKINGFIEALNHIFIFGENNKFENCDVLFVCHEVDFGFEYNQKKYSPNIDTLNELISSLGYKTAKIIKPYTTLDPDEIYGLNFTVNGIFGRSAFKERFFMYTGRESIKQGSYRIDTWYEIIRSINPRLIISIQPPRELCMAAKRHEVWVADLQHGVISEDHYYSQNYREIYDQSGWPDCILCWNNKSKIWIDEHYSEFVNSRVVGHPFIQRFIEKKETDNLVQDSLRHICSSDKGNETILFTAQWTNLGKLDLLAIGLSESIIDLIKDDRSTYQWWIRIHPKTLNIHGSEKVFNLLSERFSNNNNVFWDIPTLEPLPVILSKSNLHITYNSAVTIEAALFGIKTALLSSNRVELYDWFSEEISSGSAETVVDDSVSLKEWIKSKIHSKDKINRGKSIDYSEELKSFLNDINTYLQSRSNNVSILNKS